MPFDLGEFPIGFKSSSFNQVSVTRRQPTYIFAMCICNVYAWVRTYLSIFSFRRTLSDIVGGIRDFRVS